jgi:type II secretory pathway component PulF
MDQTYHRRAGYVIRRTAPPSVPDLIESLALAVAAGDTVNLAVRRVAASPPRGWKPLGDETLHRLQRGQRLVDALSHWRGVGGLDLAEVVEVLVAADRDGGPLAGVLRQLSSEARAQRRREAMAQARQLPVRLAAPLVLCTLPSFVLLGVVPLVAGAVASLDLNLAERTP